MRSLLITAILLALGEPVFAGVAAPSGAYALDPEHGYITFSYSHMGFSTPHIGFTRFTVDVELDAQNPAQSSVSVEIDARSIDSRVDVFNEHLNGSRFFDTEEFPRITFVSHKVVMNGDSAATITGNLTIKGITREIALEATLNRAAMHPMKEKHTLGMNAQARVKRSDWGLDYGIPNVGDEVSIFISVELIKQ